MHEILIFAGCRTGERRASGGEMPPCADFPYRLYHQDLCCLVLCSDHYVMLGYATLGVGSVCTCFILLDVRRGIAALRILGLLCVDSFDDRQTCRV